jgi:hypothetical protein
MPVSGSFAPERPFGSRGSSRFGSKRPICETLLPVDPDRAPKVLLPPASPFLKSARNLLFPRPDIPHAT